jgi:hypothetical protein
MRTLTLLPGLLLLSLLACGDDGGDTDDPTATMGSATSTMTDPTGGPVEQTCAGYCAAISANCSGPTAQYSTEQDCLSVCAAFPAGAAADMAGNTLGCRIYHAGAAADDAVTHCPHAGPGGGGACGSDCESFCTIAAAACPGAFADMAACMGECAGFDASEVYDASDIMGNTFACRMYHLTVASNAPDPHCTHIVAASMPCG